MPKDPSLTSARAWAIIYVAFAGFLVLALLAVDYILNESNAYPGYDLDMFWSGPHLPYYLAWPDILFGWDAVVAEMPYDIMTALFMAGFAVTFIQQGDETATSIMSPRAASDRDGSLVNRVARAAREPAFVPMAIAVAIAVVAFIGSAGGYGYQVPGLDGAPVFITGLDDFTFTSHLLPMVMFFSGFFATGFLPLINAARAKTRVKREGLLLVIASILLLSAYYALSPVHYELLLPPLAIIHVLKGWIVGLVVSGYAICLHARRVERGTRRSNPAGEQMQGEASGGKRAQRANFVVDARVGLVTSIPAWILLAVIVWGVIDGGLTIAEHPSMLFQHAFNMAFSCALAIGLVHVAGRFLVGPSRSRDAVAPPAMPREADDPVMPGATRLGITQEVNVP